jgi:hypothetical protein
MNRLASLCAVGLLDNWCFAPSIWSWKIYKSGSKEQVVVIGGLGPGSGRIPESCNTNPGFV